MQAKATTGQGIDALVRERALALGFDVVGVARADVPLDVDHDRYRAFVAGGMHGEMGYLADHVEARRRLDTDDVLPGAKSVVCVGRRYGRSAEDEAADPALAKAIARYARGHDYHNHLRKRVRRLAAFLRTLGPDVRARPLCDVEPVLERAWATRAGLGFVGKNGLLITPGQGSYQLLGEVVTTLDLAPGVPLAERCGSCTRCLDACPTQAFQAPFVLDPRRCIAYLTIEARTAPPEPLRAAMGEHLFGCDVCQEVCPFNRAAPPAPGKVGSFRPLERWGRVGLDDLIAPSDAAWDALSEGTPLGRATPSGLARNAVLVAAHRLRGGEGGGVERRVIEAACAHGDPIVAEVGAWARESLGGSSGDSLRAASGEGQDGLRAPSGEAPSATASSREGGGDPGR